MSNKINRNYGSKVPWYCMDGPFKGQCLFLHNGWTGTLSFSVPGWNGGETGRYVRDVTSKTSKVLGGHLGFTIELPDDRLKWETAKCQKLLKSI